MSFLELSWAGTGDWRADSGPLLVAPSAGTTPRGQRIDVITRLGALATLRATGLAITGCADTGYICGMNVTGVADAVDVMGPAHLDQAAFAAAVNVTQVAVGRWLSGRCSTPSEIQEVLAQLGHAWAAPSVRLGTDPLGRFISAPVEPWRPVFRPRGRFRLGIHLNWSGAANARWFDAADAGDIVRFCSLVLTNGSAADVRTWIDPELFARFLPLFRISDQRRTAWAEHLQLLGYTVGDGLGEAEPRAAV